MPEQTEVHVEVAATPREVMAVLTDLAVEPGVPLPGLLKRQAARQVARSALADLKRRVEAG